MGQYVLRDALMRVGTKKARRGDVVEISDEHAERLLKSGAIAPLEDVDVEPVAAGSAETRTAGEAEGEEVPDGTADDVLAWVGDDPERASWALEVEHTRDKPRSTLTAQLEKLAEG